MPDLADLITVLVVTSPTSSDPSTDTIDATIESCLGHLPPATRYLIGCDGVRPSQRSGQDAYDEKIAALRWWTAHTVLSLDHWGHQANVMRMLLEHVETPLLLFMEHDTPLLPCSIDWQGCAQTILCGELDSIRFLHESHILPDHEHLMRGERRSRFKTPYIATSQWSQRPHLARTQWYREIIHTYFASSSRTMIEDVMYGVVSSAWRLNGLIAWDRFRLGIYNDPNPTMQRSDHLDGRAGAEKGGMVFAYPGETPEGAPAPTLGRVFE